MRSGIPALRFCPARRPPLCVEEWSEPKRLPFLLNKIKNNSKLLHFLDACQV
jgi:hypothetical protein